MTPYGYIVIALGAAFLFSAARRALHHERNRNQIDGLFYTDGK